MIALTHRQRSRCAITGLSLNSLAKIGDKLSVDRIDSSLGYVPGNMQLMSMDLNTAKGPSTRVPTGAIRRLFKRAERKRHSRLSEPPRAGAALC